MRPFGSTVSHLASVSEVLYAIDAVSGTLNGLCSERKACARQVVCVTNIAVYAALRAKNIERCTAWLHRQWTHSVFAQVCAPDHMSLLSTDRDDRSAAALKG